MKPLQVGLFIVIGGLSVDRASAAEKPPNIVIILADDFGVGDIKAHYPKNKIPTPHLDRLVRQGMSFTDAHSPSAVCSPTRYGLLTGRYAWRTRLQEWVIAAYEPPLITKGRATLPGFLQKQGYHTACIGKWHLGWQWQGPQASRMTEKRNGQASLRWDFTKPIREGPTARGFDYYFGVDLPNLPPFTFIENDRVVTQPTAKYKLDPEEGIVLPKGFVGAPMAPGWRMQKILPEITQRAVKHVHEQAKKDKPFFLYFSMTSPHEPVVPSKAFRGKSGIAPIADFVMETDWSAGQVIKAIDEAGIADNTVVIFTADNGHSHYTGWDSLIKAEHFPSGEYRGHKGDIWEGGHRVPLIVRWPKHVPAGKKSDQLICLTDLFATSADIVGAKLPATGAEDSLSFLPAMLGKSKSERKSIVNHSNHGEFAYHDGPWKLVFKMSGRNLQQSRGKATVTELYNLKSDSGEKSEVSKTHPEIVTRLTKELRALITRGTSRVGQKSANDTQVDFEKIQKKRWAPARIKDQSRRTWQGHQSWVSTVAFSPDGKWILSGGSDETMKLWDARSGKELLTVKVKSAITAAAFSPDGKLLLSGHWNGVLKLWDARTGKALRSLSGHRENITSVAFSPDGKRIVSGSGDDSLKVQEIKTGKVIFTVQIENEYDVTCAAFSPDGKTIAVGDGENVVHILDAEDGEELFTLNGHQATISCVAFSPDGKYLVSGSWDDSLKVWDVSDGAESLTLRGHQGDITCVAFSPDGKTIVSGSEDKTLKVWAMSTGKALATLHGHAESITSLALSPNGKEMVSASKKILKIWKLPQKTGRN